MLEEKKSPWRNLVGAMTLLFLLALSVVAQRQERMVQSWKPVHYDVELNFDEQLSGFTAARTRISVAVLSPTLNTIDLDFGDLPIDSVLVSDKPAQFQRTAETLNVMLAPAAKRGDKLAITVNYHGHPKDGLVFARDRDGNPSATGDNWPNRVHYWIPSLDHPSAKATVSFTISAPQRYEVTANGKFITLTGNAVTSHWKYEEAKAIPPYCMVVAVNQGAIINTEYQPVPLSYNVPQKDRDYAPKGFSPAGPAISFFSQTIAPYPYEKLALIIGATRFGGMENSSAIVFTNTLFDQRPDEFSAPAGNSTQISRRFGIPTRIESVVAHEIAHQWFGDSVTESTWADLWLSEGFATYFAGLFIENQDGEAAFREYMEDAARRYFNFEKQAASFPIHDTETKDLMGLLNPNNYEKGAWVLHMLRSRLGDDAFFKGLRAYYNAHKEANATTEDLRAALEKSSGKDLKQFFQRWVYGDGDPRYELSWGSMERASVTNVTIRLIQLQAGDAFLDPVPVEFTVSGKNVRRTIVPTGKSTQTTVQLPGNPSAVTIDPDGTLLKEVSSIKP
jgi:aminopeptidase N